MFIYRKINTDIFIKKHVADINHIIIETNWIFSSSIVRDCSRIHIPISTSEVFCPDKEHNGKRVFQKKPRLTHSVPLRREFYNQRANCTEINQILGTIKILKNIDAEHRTQKPETGGDRTSIPRKTSKDFLRKNSSPAANMMLIKERRSQYLYARGSAGREYARTSHPKHPPYSH